MSELGYMSCIQDLEAHGTRSLCGRECKEWMFKGVDHAVLSVQKGMRILPCPICMVTAYEELNEALGLAMTNREER